MGSNIITATVVLVVLFMIGYGMFSISKLNESQKLIVLSNPYKTGVINNKFNLSKEEFAIKVKELNIKRSKEFELTNYISDLTLCCMGDTLYLSRLTTRIISIHKLRS